MKARAAFFDLDSTLLDCNSATLWLRYEYDGGRVGLRDVAWGMWFVLQYQMGRGPIDRAFSEAVATLKGVEEAVIKQRTFEWFEAQVRRRLRPGAKKALEQHRANGDRLILATSSSPYAAEAAVQAFGLEDFVCSRFEVLEGRFTGKVSSSALGAAKADRVAEWAEAHGVDLGVSAFYTDSVTDAAPLQRVGEPVAVNPDRPLLRLAREKGWRVEDWGLAAPP